MNEYYENKDNGLRDFKERLQNTDLNLKKKYGKI